MSMPDVTHLIEEADRQLEANNFALAGELFRDACMLAPPTRHIFTNLRVAEEQERLQFYRQLEAKYPDSLLVKSKLMGVYLDMPGHWKARAIDISTKLLQTLTLEIAEELRLRRIRFSTMLRCADYATPDRDRVLTEDFTYLWQAGNHYPWATKTRGSLLAELAGVADPILGLAVASLAEADWLPAKAGELLRKKADELLILSEVIQSDHIIGNP